MIPVNGKIGDIPKKIKEIGNVKLNIGYAAFLELFKAK